MNHDGYMFHQFKTCFCVFKSLDGIWNMIYIKQSKDLICYNIIQNQIINQIIKDKYQPNDIRHHLDTQLKRDLILISYAESNEIEVCNFKNFQIIIKINHINNGGFLFSACFYNDNNNIYIITSDNKVTNIHQTECMKVFDLKKNKIKEIPNSNEDTFYIDTYYDSKLDNNFLVSCNSGHINFYDFKKNSLFKKYESDCSYSKIRDYLINDKEDNKVLIGSNYYSILIWDFFGGELIKKIGYGNKDFFGICLLNKNYLLTGVVDKNHYPNSYPILIELTNKKNFKKIKADLDKPISCIKSIDTENGKLIICGGRWSDIIILENKELEFKVKTIIEQDA